MHSSSFTHGPFLPFLHMYHTVLGSDPIHTPTSHHLYNRLLAVCPMAAIGHTSHHSNHMEKADVMTTVKPIPVLSLDKLPESCCCRSRNIPASKSSEGRVNVIREGEDGGFEQSSKILIIR